MSHGGKHPLVEYLSGQKGLLDGWYFIDETWGYVGPYADEPGAQNALAEYIRELA